MPPGAPVARKLIMMDDLPPEFKLKSRKGNASAAGEDLSISIEEYTAWCTERGLPVNIDIPEDDHLEPLIFHSPVFPDSNNFEGSWVISQSVRDALREPFPIPKLSPLYEIKPSPGRGLGMFATRDIDAGRDILYEHPLVVIDRTMRGLPSTMSKDDIFQLIFDRLDPPLQEKLMSLANCKTSEEAGPVEGIIRTNAFAIDLNSGQSKEGLDLAAVLLELSRCNHSCSPNALNEWDERTYSMKLFAIRRIAAGEEIFVTYTDIVQPRDVRQKRLKLMYDFDCVCTACALPNAQAIRESDARRAVVAKWRASRTPQDPKVFLIWLRLPNDRTPPAETVFAPSLQIAEAHAKEGIPVPFSVAEIVCGMYAALGDEQKYREWGEWAIDFIRVMAIRSKSEGDARSLRDYLMRVKNPKSITYWGEKASPKG